MREDYYMSYFIGLYMVGVKLEENLIDIMLGFVNLGIYSWTKLKG